MKFHVGTSGYSYREWKGKFYPKTLAAEEMLSFYADRFGAVEINNTFYRMPKVEVLKQWAREVPGEFLFAFKAPQRITHFQRLKDAGDSVGEFFKSISAMKGRLGPVLFGLPPNFKKDAARLAGFLRLLPRRRRIAFEFRHESWFDREVFDLLRECNVALCIAHDEEVVEVPFAATADWGYLRLRNVRYSDADLKRWIKQIRRQRWREVLVFFKHEEKATGPKLATRFLELAG